MHYDGTVRNADSSIMQFEYGGDGLEPASMEGPKWPVEFERILNCVKAKNDHENHSLIAILQATNPHKDEPALSPTQLQELGETIDKDDYVTKKCSRQFMTALR